MNYMQKIQNVMKTFVEIIGTFDNTVVKNHSK